jgi:hypothetical protein
LQRLRNAAAPFLLRSVLQCDMYCSDNSNKVKGRIAGLLFLTMWPW